MAKTFKPKIKLQLNSKQKKTMAKTPKAKIKL